MKEEHSRPAGAETAAVEQRYSRRPPLGDDSRYSALNPATWQTLHERQRAMLRLFAARGVSRLNALNLVEVGCGTGGNLLEFLRLGFAPQRLVGIELLADRAALAREVLPAATKVFGGDALDANVPQASQDIVFQAVVFSSLLDESYQQRLADAMWAWVRPGGAVLWYDFVYDNPSNADVRGVSVKRVRALFPRGRLHVRRITLAPPLARAACAIHPSLYGILNSLPLLRTHVLCWIEKP